MVMSAPSCFSRSIFASLDEVAITRAPIIFANCSANSDTPPVPWVRMVWPGRVLPSLTTALQAVSPAQGREAASASLK